MPRALITGGAGLLGSTLLRDAPAGWELHATQRRAPVSGAAAHTVDLADGDAVDALWARLRPELVIHTAYTMETPERNVELATGNVARATRAVGAHLVHMSSDMVFGGDLAPYAESAPPAPITPYGRAKAVAERAVTGALPLATIVRTSLLVSLEPLDPRCAWVAAGARGEERARLYVDELRSPIAVDDLAAQIWEIVAMPAEARAGIWHLAGPEALSRYAIGVLVAAALGLPTHRLERGLHAESTTPRPRDLRLLTTRADETLTRRARPISALVPGADIHAPGDRP